MCFRVLDHNRACKSMLEMASIALHRNFTVVFIGPFGNLGIGIGTGIGIVKNLFLPYEYFFKKNNKNKHLCLINVKIISFA